MDLEKEFTKLELEFLIKWYEVTRPKVDIRPDTDKGYFEMVERLDAKIFNQEVLQ